MLEGNRPMFKSRMCVFAMIVVLLAGLVPAWAQTVASKSDEGKLIATLTSPDASRKDKADACRQLSIIGTKAAIAPLASLLGDPEMSHMARYALEPIPDPAVDRAFREALGKLSGRPLIGVIASIGVRRDAEAIEPLTKMLMDGQVSPEAMGAAVRSLGRIGTVAAAQVLTASLDHAPPEGMLDVYEGLFRCAEMLAAEGNGEEATAIYDRLRQVKEPHQVRAGALRGAILMRRGRERAALIREHLRSDDYVLFAAACKTALDLPASGVTRALTESLPQLPADNQILVIQTLGKRGDVASLPTLFDAARTGPAAVRIAALKAIPEIGDASAVPVLASLMADADRQISQTAQESLASLPRREADQAVMKFFESDQINERQAALEMMGRRRMTRAAAILLRAAGSAEEMLRPAIIRMVGELGGSDQLAPLLDLLDNLESTQDLDAARQAISAVCAKMDGQTAAAMLVGRLGRAAPAQKIVLLRVLSGVGGPTALTAVRDAVDDPDRDVRIAAIRALGAWRTADAARHLLALAKAADNPSNRMLCLRSYLGFAARRDLPTETRLSMCREAAELVRRDDEKTLLLGTLGGIDSIDALTLIEPHLADSTTRQEATVAALGIADRLLSHRDAKQYAARLIEPLEKVAEAAPNDNLAQRARTLLAQARTKAGR
jgi:HEAT repeat protein